MSKQEDVSEQFERVGEILDEQLAPLVLRTRGRADFLTEEMPQGFLGIHLASQVEVNLKEIERLVFEALSAWRPDDAKKVTD